MKKLSKKSYWASLYNPNKINKQNKFIKFFSYSFQNYEYFSIIKKYLKKTDKNIIEIGCAPGGYLIKAYEKLKLTPYGVEYTENGQKLTKENLKINGIKKFKIFHSDAFDKKFQKENKEKFDVVFSNGFIEHFDDYKKTLNSHINLVKKNGTIAISMPNLKYLNKKCLTQKIIDIHNLEIMDLKFLKKNVPENVKIKYISYGGGPFNLGLFFFDNKIIELIRICGFVFQRLIIDPILILLFKIGINFKNKQTSPSIIIIYKKIK